jgi:tetratricopeptide (TPR) repeat protein
LRARQAAGLALGLGLAAAAGRGVARADGPEDWSALFNARLLQSADNDADGAAAAYETLLAQLPADDPLRPEVLYWLGRARAEQGRPDEAVEALRAAAGDARVRARARAFHEALRLGQRAVRGLPLGTGFDAGDAQPFVRAADDGDPDDLSTQVAPGHGQVLAWAREVREGADGVLLVRLDGAAQAVERLGLALGTVGGPAHVRVRALDADGRWWTAPLVSLPPNTWARVDLRRGDFLPAEAPAAARALTSPITRLELRDLTAAHDVFRGEHTLRVDDLTLR